MPTVVLTQRTHQVTQVNQQRQPGEAMGHPIHARQASAGGPGRRLGGGSEPHQDPDNHDKISQNSVTRTPSARAKVLPWVQGVTAQADSPEGMFGPYDSQPPTRVQTMYNDPRRTGKPAGTQATPSAAHPFAYSAATAVPFAALATAEPLDPLQGLKELIDSEGSGRSQQRPESEVLSRGAGMKATAQPASQHRDTVGTGTFGVGTGTEGSSAQQKARSPKPAKEVKTARPSGHADTAPKLHQHQHEHRAHTHHPPHLHHPHHEHAFSPHEAARKQAAAMEAARSAAHAQQGPFAGDQPFAHPAFFDGPPFMPGGTDGTQTPRAEAGLGSVPMSRDPPFFPPSPFIRIPFGMPMSAGLPAPPLVLLRGAPPFGLGMPSLAELHGLEDSPMSDKQRSAYVETVEDEEAPTHHSPAMTKNQSTINNAQADNRGSKSAQPRHESVSAQSVKRSPGREPPRKSSSNGIKSSAKKAERRSKGSDQPNASLDHSRRSSKKHDVLKAGSLAAPGPGSDAPTTATNIKKLVAESKCHDETLCQLLDAARLNLIGDKAKKALNRAARARIIELSNLKEEGQARNVDIPPMPPLLHSPSPLPSHLSLVTQDSVAREASANPSPAQQSSVAIPDGNSNPPAWAQEIIRRLGMFDEKFAALEKQQQQQLPQQQYPQGDRQPPSGLAGAHGPVASEGYPQFRSSFELMNDLIMNELGGAGFGPEFRPLVTPGDFPIPFMPQGMFANGPNGPHQPAAPQTRPTTSGDELLWGSEVELPNPNDTVPPPQGVPAGPPMIHVQAPTESNVARTAPRVPSVSGYSQGGGGRTPRQGDIALPDTSLDHAALDKDLPAPPMQQEMPIPRIPQHAAQQARNTFGLDDMPSHAVSAAQPPVLGAVMEPADADPSPRQASTPRESGSMAFPVPRVPSSGPHSTHTAAAVTAPTHPTGAGVTQSGDGQTSHDHGKEVQTDTNGPSDTFHTAHHAAIPPWDLVQQRLYSWAMIWEEQSFVRSMEGISLGQQVDEMPLSIYVMKTIKRHLSRSLNRSPPKICDKLFVPPNMSDAINKAVHDKNFHNARQVLEEMWYQFGFREPPRVIVAFARHRNEDDQWAAHRFDLSSGCLTSYIVSNEQKTLLDGRPFMWWHAIREAWPQYKIPHPDSLSQRVEHIKTLPENRLDNSLVAFIYARNLLLGWRPETQGDVVKLRENVWAEVKELLRKKKKGRLILTMDTHRDTPSP